MNADRPSADQAAVARALLMAVHLPTQENRALRVQVLDRYGTLLGAATLDGHEQVAFLLDVLQTVGAFDLVPPGLASGRGCDVMLRESYASRRPDLPADLVRFAPDACGDPGVSGICL